MKTVVSSRMSQSAEKLKVLIYSGHCEIVGGDAKYILEMINELDQNRFEIRLLTDANTPFPIRLKEWLKVALSVKYLQTYPNVSRLSYFDAFIQKRPKLRASLECRLSTRIALRASRFIYQWLALQYIKSKFINALVFIKTFSEEAKNTDFFWFNNGGYPGKEAGLVSLFIAKCFGVKRIAMTIHNVPAVKGWFRPSDFIYDFLVGKICDEIIVPSENICRDLELKRNLPRQKLKVIYCGLTDSTSPPVEASSHLKQKLNIAPEVQVLLITGSLDERRKGHEFLLAALSEVTKRTNEQFFLLVAGSGTPDRVKELKLFTEKYSLTDRVKFLGYRTDIAALSAITDIGIVPSNGDEATPYTIKEFLRAGKPVITTTAGGCAEGVEAGVSGLVVEPDQPIQLANAILVLLMDRGRRELMGKKAREYFLQKFLLSEKVKQHEFLIEGLTQAPYC